MQASFAFLGESLSSFAAGLCFAIKALRNRRWAAHLTESQNLNLKITAISFDGKPVSCANFSRGARGLMIGFHSAQFARAGSERAGLEESSRPEPFVETHTVHAVMVTARPALSLRPKGRRRCTPKVLVVTRPWGRSFKGENLIR